MKTWLVLHKKTNKAIFETDDCTAAYDKAFKSKDWWVQLSENYLKELEPPKKVKGPKNDSD
jgi:hypothetical protein